MDGCCLIGHGIVMLVLVVIGGAPAGGSSTGSGGCNGCRGSCGCFVVVELVMIVVMDSGGQIATRNESSSQIQSSDYSVPLHL